MALSRKPKEKEPQQEAGQAKAEEPKASAETETAPPVPESKPEPEKAKTEAAPRKKNHKGTGTFQLITEYPIVSPKSKGGVRFLPNEDTLHVRCSWIDAQIEAKLLVEVKR